MKVSGTGGTDMLFGGTSMASGAGGQTDEVSRNLQKQIEDLQRQMKELSANQDTPPETKMKKRQELQKEISELQVQLRQHQMELKREETQKKEEKNSQDNIFDSCSISEQGRQQSEGLSAGSMEALISADASMKQASVQGSTAKYMENRAGILEAEIKRDKGGPGDATAAKEEALAKTKAVAEQATVSQMELLNRAGEAVKEASEPDSQGASGQTEEEEQVSAAGQSEDTEAPNRGMVSGAEVQETNATDPQESVLDGRRNAYHPVDVRI